MESDNDKQRRGSRGSYERAKASRERAKARSQRREQRRSEQRRAERREGELAAERRAERRQRDERIAEEIRRHLAITHRTYIDDHPNRDAFIVKFGNGSVDARQYGTVDRAQRAAISAMSGACGACRGYGGLLEALSR